jgi:2-polyprenyl-6-methoxyphenol hydroxylase-like FAD-dependent oxidoreductase
VGADGGNSIVRQVFNIPTYGWEYRQKGIVATVQVDETLPNDAAWQRFLPTGPLALLPVILVRAIDMIALSRMEFYCLVHRYSNGR